MENEEAVPVKERHGCATAWLILMMAGGAIMSFLYLFWKQFIDAGIPHKMERSFVVLAIIGLANIFFAFSLFRWKLWGFYGIVITSILIFVVNLNAGVSPFDAMPGLVGVVILFAVLQMRKGEISAWDQMEKRVRTEDPIDEKTEE